MLQTKISSIYCFIGPLLVDCFFFGWNDIPLKLQQHPGKLKEFKSLEGMVVDLIPATSDDFLAHIFIESIESLQRISIRGNHLSANDFEIFVKNQKTPNGWKCSVYFEVFYKCERQN